MFVRVFCSGAILTGDYWLARDTRHGARAKEVREGDRGGGEEVAMSRTWVAANGQEITEEMIDHWCDAYERGESPQIVGEY